MKHYAMRSLTLLALSMAVFTAFAAAPRESADVLDNKRRSDARLELANAYFSEGRYEIALDEVELALDAWPDRADAHALRGLSLMKLGEPELAVRSMQSALSIAPDDPAVQNNMGWVLCESGKAMQGLPYFDGALGNGRYASPANAARNAGLCSL